jgi:cysteine desulfurase
MWANNETGTVFPMDALEQIAKSKGVYFHTDAVQAAGKIPVSVHGKAVHFMSLSGHKLHCPKGIGALYVNRKTRFTPFMTGGSQEGGKRGGTQNVASIVAFGKACELAVQQQQTKEQELRKLRDHFEAAVLQKITAVQINGDPANRLPNTTNLAFEGVDGEALLILLDENNIACSAGSACTSGSVNPSHVLKAMGCSDTHARSSLRFSFSHYNTLTEIDNAVTVMEKAVAKIRAL